MGKKQTYLGFLALCIFISLSCFGQENSEKDKIGKVSKLFATADVLPVKMSYVNKDLKRHTNDSVYLDRDLLYAENKDSMRTIPVKIRARGNFRRENCYFVPIKLSIEKQDAKESLFKGNKELKMVLPCLKENNANDNVIKELLAYKLYELISKYHFKTRLLDFNLNEPKGKKLEAHQVRAFFIEDIDELEERFGANKVDRNVHPLQQDSLYATRNAFFQYMIGNTDFSVGYQHNQKLLFVDGFYIPIPYDFDMSGLCDVSYSVVSQIGGDMLPITSVTERLYRGFKRSDGVTMAVKNEFLENQDKMMAVIDAHEVYFEEPKEFLKCKTYIKEFFEILQNPVKFKTEILDKERLK